jgi:hypothetical protein
VLDHVFDHAHRVLFDGAREFGQVLLVDRDYGLGLQVRARARTSYNTSSV